MPLTISGGDAMTIYEQAADVVEASEPEHTRLVGVSRAMEPYVRETCARVGLTPGAKVIEVGCGSLGALLSLSAIVGPEGVVVGLDRDREALDTARSILTIQGEGNVRLVQADLVTLTPAHVCPPTRTDPSPLRSDGPAGPRTDPSPLRSDGPAGPFDLAYGHFVLCYQTDVVEVLQRVAAVVRPGGHIVVQEAVFTAPIPIEMPGRFVSAANLLMNEWFPALLGTMGACWDVAERYSMLCREAGLLEVEQRIFAPSLPPAQVPAGIAAYRDLLEGVRPLLARHGIATAGEIDRVLGMLRATREERYSAPVFTHLRAELVARVV